MKGNASPGSDSLNAVSPVDARLVHIADDETLQSLGMLRESIIVAIDRRAVLAAFAGAMATAAMPNVRAATPAQVAPELVDYFRSQLAGHYQADMFLGPRHLIGTVFTVPLWEPCRAESKHHHRRVRQHALWTGGSTGKPRRYSAASSFGDQ